MAIRKLGADLDSTEFVAGVEEELEADLRGGKPKTRVVRPAKAEADDEDDTDEVVDEDEADDAESDDDTDDAETDDTDEDKDDEPEDDADDDKSEESAAKKRLTPEKAKIVGLKRALKQRDKELRELRAEREKESAKARESALSEQFHSEGYDKDTAAHMARTQLNQEAQEHKLRVLEFRVEHADLLREYPDAAGDVEIIMDRAAKSGMTVSQVVRGMYGGLEPDRDRRARQAALGTTPRARTDDAVSRATRYAETDTGGRLGGSDRENKAYIENLIGKKLSNERFVELKSKYGF